MDLKRSYFKDEVTFVFQSICRQAVFFAWISPFCPWVVCCAFKGDDGMIGNISNALSYQQTGTQQRYGVYSSDSAGEILQSDKQSRLEMRHEIYERTKEKSKSDQLLQSIKVQSASLQNSRTKVKNTSMQMKKLRYRYNQQQNFLYGETGSKSGTQRGPFFKPREEKRRI